MLKEAPVEYQIFKEIFAKFLPKKIEEVRTVILFRKKMRMLIMLIKQI